MIIQEHRYSFDKISNLFRDNNNNNKYLAWLVVIISINVEINFNVDV